MKNANNIKIGVIYKYTSPSGKIYVGQTINEASRKNKHKSETSKSDTYFGKAIRKYGWENLKYETIIKFKPTLDKQKLKKVLNALEKRYIILYQSNNRNFGYNLNEGGDGNLGYEHTEETIIKISNASKERMENIEYKENAVSTLKNTFKGHSDESKKSLSEKCLTKKRISKYDGHMILIAIYDSISEAAKHIDGDATHKTKSNRISECINGKWKSAYNFIWIKE